MTVHRHTARARSPRPPSRCPRSASRSARSSKARRTAGKTVGTVDDFPDNNYIPVVITLTPGHRRGRQGDRVRAQVQPGDRHRPLRPRHALHRDLQPLRAPRLPGALGGRRRALHLSLPRRRLRPARPPRRRAAGAAARPLLHARGRRRRRRSARASASTASCAASPRATPASRWTASASTSTRRAPARRNCKPESPSIVPKLPKLPAPLPSALKAPPPRPGEGNGKAATPVEQARRTPGSPSSTGSTSAPR